MIKVLDPFLAFRNRKVPPTTIVLHATAGSTATSSISWLRKIKLSYHAIVGDGTVIENKVTGQTDNGKIYKCVPDTKVAFHAGKSQGPSGANVNDYSFGLSFACMDDGRDKITVAQWEAATRRCAQWVEAFPTVKYITTHALISPGRKVDPRGPVLAHAQENGKFPLQAFVLEVNKLLAAKGLSLRVSSWVG